MGFLRRSSFKIEIELTQFVFTELQYLRDRVEGVELRHAHAHVGEEAVLGLGPGPGLGVGEAVLASLGVGAQHRAQVETVLCNMFNINQHRQLGTTC